MFRNSQQRGSIETTIETGFTGLKNWANKLRDGTQTFMKRKKRSSGREIPFSCFNQTCF